MAQHGGGVSTRRILGSTAAASRLATVMPNVSPPLPAPVARTIRDQPIFSLDQPRPDVARKQNEYIDTPLRPHQTSSKSFKSSNKSNFKRVEDPGPVVPDVLCHTRTILTQPSAVTTFKKDVIKPSDVYGEDGDHDDSIICTECGKCKCEACKIPKKLPSKWLCKTECLCSAGNVIEYSTCMCCVKGVFYHCGNMDSDDGSCGDDPCSCGVHRRCLRWSVIPFLSLCLPCLWCYWPLRGCHELCELCYSKVKNNGCTCSANNKLASTVKKEKNLLDSV